jgi:hypothetical protein
LPVALQKASSSSMPSELRAFHHAEPGISMRLQILTKRQRNTRELLDGCRAVRTADADNLRDEIRQQRSQLLALTCDWDHLDLVPHARLLHARRSALDLDGGGVVLVGEHVVVQLGDSLT